jgi:preprotein translocase SecE subunit
MARTRQKAKQRKAKRLEQERKAGERGPEGGAATSEAAAEVADAQREAAAELSDHQAAEVGAAREAARSAAALEAATAAEAATTQEVEDAPTPDAPPRLGWRERRRAQSEVKEKEKRPARAREKARADGKKARPGPRAERKREPRGRGQVANFFAQVWAELRRVQWPNRTQVTQATAIVVVFCAIAGAYLAIWDYLFNQLIKGII